MFFRKMDERAMNSLFRALGLLQPLPSACSYLCGLAAQNWSFNGCDNVSQGGEEAKFDPKGIGEHENCPKGGGLREGKGNKVSVP